MDNLDEIVIWRGRIGRVLESLGWKFQGGMWCAPTGNSYIGILAALDEATRQNFANIRSAALALPVEDRHRLRAELAATLPLPSGYVPVPALLAHEAGKMSAAQVEELIGLLTKRRPS